MAKVSAMTCSSSATRILGFWVVVGILSLGSGMRNHDGPFSRVTVYRARLRPSQSYIFHTAGMVRLSSVMHCAPVCVESLSRAMEGAREPCAAVSRLPETHSLRVNFSSLYWQHLAANRPAVSHRRTGDAGSGHPEPGP